MRKESNFFDVEKHLQTLVGDGVQTLVWEVQDKSGQLLLTRQ